MIHLSRILGRGSLGLAVLAVACWIAAAARATDDEGPGHAGAKAANEHEPHAAAHAAGADHGGHHEPSALEHVIDDESGHWHLLESLDWSFQLPTIFGMQITKYMVLELIAAGLILAIYIPIAKRRRDGSLPKGAWDNTFECLLTFIREELAKPNLGEHDADKYVPFLWTLFLFILFNNLLGMFPFLGSATSSIYVTGALALVVFFALHGAAIAKMGFGHYVQSMWPHIDLHGPAGFMIKALVFVLEVQGVLIKNLVLAIRLFANMFAGHVVLATILIFIYSAGTTAFALWSTVTVSSVVGMVGLSLLELFVAFLQAYIFTFLTSLFMGMALHPQH